MARDDRKWHHLFCDFFHLQAAKTIIQWSNITFGDDSDVKTYILFYNYINDCKIMFNLVIMLFEDIFPITKNWLKTSLLSSIFPCKRKWCIWFANTSVLNNWSYCVQCSCKKLYLTKTFAFHSRSVSEKYNIVTTLPIKW